MQQSVARLSSLRGQKPRFFVLRTIMIVWELDDLRRSTYGVELVRVNKERTF